MENYPRGFIKVNLFKEVFYSKILGGVQQIYAKEFKKVYPNVYKLVYQFRKNHVKNGDEHLAHNMMKLESEIFQKILKKLFVQKIIVVNIHDAIVILDVPENDGINPEDIFRIIIDVYSKYKLIPSVKTEFFSPYNATKQLTRLNNNEEEIQKFKTELDNICENPAHTQHKIAKNISGALERGKYFLKMGNQHVYLDYNLK